MDAQWSSDQACACDPPLAKPLRPAHTDAGPKRDTSQGISPQQGDNPDVRCFSCACKRQSRSSR